MCDNTHVFSCFFFLISSAINHGNADKQRVRVPVVPLDGDGTALVPVAGRYTARQHHTLQEHHVPGQAGLLLRLGGRHARHAVGTM